MSSRPRPHPWQWVHVAVAALAMAATLPGRTQGLGLFTEPILAETGFDRVTYGTLNLAATFLGALLCLPIGWLLDRFGTKIVLVAVSLLLAATVIGMSRWAAFTPLVLGLFLLGTRGYGQSAMSVVSLALIGRSAGRHGWMMGLYSCLITILFVAAFGTLREVIKADENDWRTPWFGIGVGVAACGMIGGLLIRSHLLTENCGEVSNEPSRTLRDTLLSPSFWVFALGTAFYGMVAAGTSLFNESILAERGFDKDIFLNATIVGLPFGLIANLLGGWLMTKVRVAKLFAMALALFSAALAAFPFVSAVWQVYAYVAVAAMAGGAITVCFFGIWRREYGPAHLGRIQGAAQLFTVLFSGLGQWLFPLFQSQLTEYAPLFPALAAVSLLFAIAAFLLRSTAPEAAP